MRWIGIFVFTLLSGFLEAEATPSSLAEKLIELRGQVDELNQSLELKRQDFKYQIQSMERQIADMELQIQQEKMKKQKLEQKISEVRLVRSQKGIENAQLTPIVIEALDHSVEYVNQSLPFQTQQRKLDLTELRQKVIDKSISPHKAAMRLWSFLSDETRMTHENGLFRQTISIDGDEKLATVARVGMVLLFFKTSDGLVGKASRIKNSWTYSYLSDHNQQRQVSQLMDHFKKQIRVGVFELPNTLSLPLRSVQ